MIFEPVINFRNYVFKRSLKESRVHRVTIVYSIHCLWRTHFVMKNRWASRVRLALRYFLSFALKSNKKRTETDFQLLTRILSVRYRMKFFQTIINNRQYYHRNHLVKQVNIIPLNEHVQLVVSRISSIWWLLIESPNMEKSLPIVAN